MAPHIGKAAFHLGMTVLVLALIPLPFLRPGSPEFVVDLIALAAATTFLGLIAWLVRRETRTGNRGGRESRETEGGKNQ